MGMFAKTAVVDYYLSFADQGKQTSLFHFQCRKRTEVFRFVFRLLQTTEIIYSAYKMFCEA
jgi:hypothetical protein